MRHIFFILFLVLGVAGHEAVAQQKYGPHDTVTVYATYLSDSTLVPTGVLPDAYCYARMPNWMREKIRSWTRLRNAVYVTYPYAKAAGRIIIEINKSLVGITDDGVRRKLIKAREKDLKKTFGDKVTNLSVYQGKVLMKLINRQTGSNCYDILKEYKGGANAQFWQTVAFIFGSSLKQAYEPKGADAEIEGIVKEVEILYRG